MKFTYYGHACFEVELNNKTLLFDPYFRPTRLKKKLILIKINPDYIFISHAHSDHIADAERIANKSGASLISSFEVCKWLRKTGFRK